MGNVTNLRSVRNSIHVMLYTVYIETNYKGSAMATPSFCVYILSLLLYSYSIYDFPPYSCFMVKRESCIASTTPNSRNFHHKLFNLLHSAWTLTHLSNEIKYLALNCTLHYYSKRRGNDNVSFYLEQSEFDVVVHQIRLCKNKMQHH